MKKIDIKQVAITDHYETISNFMSGLHANEKRLFGKTALWAEIKDSYMRHVLAMQEAYDGVCLVAYVDDVAVGFIFGYVEEPDDSRIEEYAGKDLYVSDGYVEAANRRMGLYSMLNSHLEQHFVASGIRHIVRYTLSNNGNMQNFLEKEGYTATRMVYEKWL